MKILCWAIITIVSMRSAIARDSLIRIEVYNYFDDRGYTKAGLTQGFKRAELKSKKIIKNEDQEVVTAILNRVRRTGKFVAKLGSKEKLFSQWSFSQSGIHKVYMSKGVIVDLTIGKIYWIDIETDRLWLKGFIQRESH